MPLPLTKQVPINTNISPLHLLLLQQEQQQHVLLSHLLLLRQYVMNLFLPLLLLFGGVFQFVLSVIGQWILN